jgi:hypothetical protein
MALLDSGLIESIRTKLQTASSPLKLADVAKGLTRPKKVKAADFQHEIEQFLEEDVRLRRTFSYPSGKDDRIRYWARDEKQLLWEKVLGITDEPHSFSALKTQLTREVKGTAPAFIEGVIREMILGGQLFEYPKGPKKSGPLYGKYPPPPPPPPLHLPKNKKVLAKIVADCRKLAAIPGITAWDVMRALQDELGGEIPQKTASRDPSSEPENPGRQESPLAPNGAAGVTVDALILKAIAQVPVLSKVDPIV